MTVVNPKSISGITSITTASGSDNLLTIHTSDANNTERLRIDSTGTTKIVTGIVTTLTATTGIVTTLTANTVTSLGAISGTTGTFTSHVSLGDNDQLRLGDATGGDLKIYHDGNNSAINDVGDGSLYIQGSNNVYIRDYDTAENHIVMTKNGAVELYNDGTKKFETSDDGASLTGDYTVIGGWPKINLQATQASGENYQIAGAISGVSNQGFSIRNTTDGANVIEIDQDSNRNLKVVSGNVVIGTSGKGIDFSATSDASGSTSEILYDYEEGLWTPTFTTGSGSITVNTNYDQVAYTKIGRVVHLTGQVVVGVSNPQGNLTIGGLPFPVLDLTEVAGRNFCAFMVYANGSGTPDGSSYYLIQARLTETDTSFLCEGIKPHADGSVADWIGNGSDFFFDITYLAA